MSWRLTETELMLADCMARESKLTDWEREFIQSIEEQATLSMKQKQQLDKIWERVT